MFRIRRMKRRCTFLLALSPTAIVKKGLFPLVFASSLIFILAKAAERFACLKRQALMLKLMKIAGLRFLMAMVALRKAHLLPIWHLAHPFNRFQLKEVLNLMHSLDAMALTKNCSLPSRGWLYHCSQKQGGSVDPDVYKWHVVKRTTDFAIIQHRKEPDRLAEPLLLVLGWFVLLTSLVSKPPISSLYLTTNSKS